MPYSDQFSYMQGGQINQELDDMGATMSLKLSCHAVRYAVWDKPIFECACGITFPAFAVKAALLSDNWDAIIKKHDA
jgi:hypothetical protein